MKDGHSEAHKDEKVWDALYIVANEINDKYFVVTLSVSTLCNRESREYTGLFEMIVGGLITCHTQYT